MDIPMPETSGASGLLINHNLLHLVGLTYIISLEYLCLYSDNADPAQVNATKEQ